MGVYEKKYFFHLQQGSAHKDQVMTGLWMDPAQK